MRERELRRRHLAGTAFPRRDLAGAHDAEALAAVVTAAVSHYWIMSDVFGGRHPHEVDAERFLRTLVGLVVPLMHDVPADSSKGE